MMMVKVVRLKRLGGLRYFAQNGKTNQEWVVCAGNCEIAYK